MGEAILSDKMRANNTINKPTNGEPPLPELHTAVGERKSLKISLPELSGSLIKVQDQERRRIARDLHDSMGQTVALLKMNLDRLAKLAKLTPEPEELLSQSLALVE